MDNTITPRPIDEIAKDIAKLEQELRAVTKIQKEAFLAKKKAEQEVKYNTDNGLTVHKIRKAGSHIKVTHIRNGLFPGDEPEQLILAPVPSYLREYSDFLSYGGVTYVEVTDIVGNAVLVFSKCHDDDNFDRREGLRRALNKFSLEDAAALLAGKPLTPPVVAA